MDRHTSVMQAVHCKRVPQKCKLASVLLPCMRSARQFGRAVAAVGLNLKRASARSSGAEREAGALHSQPGPPAPPLRVTGTFRCAERRSLGQESCWRHGLHLGRRAAAAGAAPRSIAAAPTAPTLFPALTQTAAPLLDTSDSPQPPQQPARKFDRRRAHQQPRRGPPRARASPPHQQHDGDQRDERQRAGQPLQSHEPAAVRDSV